MIWYRYFNFKIKGHLQYHRHAVVTLWRWYFHASSVYVLCTVYSLGVKYISSYPTLIPFSWLTSRSLSQVQLQATSTRSSPCTAPSPRSPSLAWSQTTQVCPLPRSKTSFLHIRFPLFNSIYNKINCTFGLNREQACPTAIKKDRTFLPF